MIHLKKISVLFIYAVFTVSFHSIHAQSDTIERLLSNNPNVMAYINEPVYTPFEASYEILFKQPIDHRNSGIDSFTQRVHLLHRGFDRPMVVELEGYSMFTNEPNELTRLLDANQIIIEHRFFASSTPDSIPWKYLDIFQAASDQHAIIQMFKELYKGKWITTGISKGGQTTVFHRRYFPEDADISVPYVAPINFSDEDRRVYEFLDCVGSQECRNRIHQFQELLFKRKKTLLPILETQSAEQNWHFTMGLNKAYDINVLEFEFSFWQWNAQCTIIPDSTASDNDLFSYWTSIADFSFIEESGIDEVRPFFYQAMTEIGMYGYRIDRFEKYLSDTVNIKFDFTIPNGVQYSFNPAPMRDVKDWLDTKGSNILFIYGALDPWSATAYVPSKTTNIKVFFNPNGTHATRIGSFPKETREEIYQTLEKWLEVQIKR